MRKRLKKRFLLFGLLFIWIFFLQKNSFDAIRSRAIGFLTYPFSTSETDDGSAREAESISLRLENEEMRLFLQQKDWERSIPEGNVVPAKVIYRSPDTWNSTLWIDVGSDHNVIYGRSVIEKNSPILVGSSVVGAIEYVDKGRSKVRLVTDKSLPISVRVARGEPQAARAAQQAEQLMAFLMQSERGAGFADLPLLIEQLHLLNQDLHEENQKWMLAKGEIQGGATPLWRGTRQKLKGIGFNYDTPDVQGAARDLRSGSVVGTNKISPIPLIKVNDLLVTTGMDGIFPPGLQVAIVTHVFPLKEGSYSYQIEAVPAAGSLLDISSVFVLPPVSNHCGW